MWHTGTLVAWKLKVNSAQLSLSGHDMLNHFASHFTTPFSTVIAPIASLVCLTPERCESDMLISVCRSSPFSP